MLRLIEIFGQVMAVISFQFLLFSNVLQNVACPSKYCRNVGLNLWESCFGPTVQSVLYATLCRCKQCREDCVYCGVVSSAVDDGIGSSVVNHTLGL